MKSRKAQEAEDEALARRLQQEEHALNGGGAIFEDADELAARFAEFDLDADWQSTCRELGALSLSDLLFCATQM